MKKISKAILSLIILTVIFSSCSSYNKVIYSAKTVDKLEKVALISTFIEFIPPIGLLHASIMNSKINSISDELNILFKDYATFYRDTLGMYLSKNCNCEVLYGEALHSNPGFVKLKKEFNFPDSLVTGEKSFPLIFQSSGDINPFKLFDAFKLESNLVKPNPSLTIKEKGTIKELCKILDVNYIAVSFTTLNAVQGNGLMRGTLSFLTVFEIFDKEGDYIAWGNRKLQGVPISARKIEEYPKVLDKFFIITKPMLSEILNKYSINKTQ